MNLMELNKEVPYEKENIDVVIAELVAREEFACIGNVSCGAGACGIKDL